MIENNYERLHKSAINWSKGIFGKNATNPYKSIVL